MNDFQRYLDDALKSLDLNNPSMEPNAHELPEYNIAQDIGELLLNMRKDMGISQRHLSEITGIPQANISKIENGHYLPSLLILKRLADALGRRLVIDFVDIHSVPEV